MGIFNIFNNKKNYRFSEKSRLMWLIPWRNVNMQTGVVYTTTNAMMITVSFRGPDTDSSTKEELIAFNAALNNVFKLMPTGYMLYFDAQRKYSKDYEKSEMPNPLLQKMEDERQEYYSSQKHFDNNFYMTFYYEPTNKIVQKITDAFIANKKHKGENSQDDLKIIMEQEKKFLASVDLWVSMLNKKFPEIRYLSLEEQLSYLHGIVSNHDQPISYQPFRFINEYLCDTGFLTGREPKLGDEHMRLITILSFRPISYPGIFRDFDKLNFKYRWVSRFICLSKLDAQKELKNYQSWYRQQLRGIFTIIREAITQSKVNTDVDEYALLNKEDVTVALAELANDNVSFGFYTMTVIVKDKDKKRCQEMANVFLEKIQSLGFTGYIETDNSAEAWFGTIPGIPDANCRRPIVSSLNFCHLAPLTAIWSGDKRNNYLKGAVLLYTDTSGSTPFRLSLHVGDLGHTMVIGPSGSGKSVLLNTLEAHFKKYKNSKVFIFDKAMSSRAITLAVGGNFFNLAAEGNNELSFQPLAKIDDEKEMKWAKDWIIGYLRTKKLEVSPAQDKAIWDGLISLSHTEPEFRTITGLTELIMDNDIREALHHLTTKGSYGKLFDNNKDISGQGNWQVFEMETLMNTPAIVPTTLDYLFHRIETSLNEASGPAIIVLDECWLFFDNPAFKDKLREYFKDMRKKNTSIIFATQNLSDIANKPELMTTIMENCPNRIYLPNINAINEQNKILYKNFGCNEQQIYLISRITPKRDYYYSSPKGNRVFQLALRPLEEAFVTATAKTDQQKITEILSKNHDINNFIEEWLYYKEDEAATRKETKTYKAEWADYKINYLRR